MNDSKRRWSCMILAALLAAVGAATLRAAPLEEALRPSAREPAADGVAAGPVEAAGPLPGDEAPGTFELEPSFDATAEVAAAAQALVAGDIRACEQQLRAAYVKSPHLPPPKLMLAQLLLAVNDAEAARRILEEAAAADRSHPELYLLFGAVALRQGRLSDAELHFEKALALDPPASWSPQQVFHLMRQVYSGQAEVAEHRRDWSQQREALTRWLEIDRTNAQLHDRLGMALFHEGRTEMAYEHFDISYRFDNSMNRPEVSMGVMAAQSGRMEAARRWFGEALSQHGEDPAVHFEWSAVLLVQDRAEEAEKHAARSAALGQTSAALVYHRGAIARRLEKYGEAEKFFRRVLAESPEHPDASHQLALVLVEQTSEAKRQEGLELARRLADEQPQSAWTLTVLGSVLYRLGELREAEEKLRAAMALGAAWPETLYFAARVLHEGGKEEDARRAAAQLRERLGRGGPFPLREEAAGWLRTTWGTE